jgi:carbonic anhydrase/acetyltransferase-like protein (isoleucine patch superfamily)
MPVIEHQGRRPHVHATAYVAPTATLCGDITIGENSCVLFGAIVSGEGGPVEIGADCVIMENAVIRGSQRHPVRIGKHVLVGPRAYLTGCTVDDDVFLATGATVFNAAHIGSGSEVRINGIVHLRTTLPPRSLVPINWIAVGDPVQILPPDQHERIWSVQQPLNFPRTVFGLERPPAGESIMPELTRRYTRALVRHRHDRILEP